METKKDKSDDIKWHPAFYSAIQLEFEEDKDKLEFTDEYQLSKEPLRIDVRIIKKLSNDKLHNEIGDIFRKFNLIEFKAPNDYISINDFYKVLGYAYLYKGLSDKINEIKANEITITFCCKRRPRELLKHLKEEIKYRIEEHSKGIYYVIGNLFPIQIILNTAISVEQHIYIRSLDNKLEDKNVMKSLVDGAKKNIKDLNFSSLLEVVIKANPLLFEEVLNMNSNTAELKRVLTTVMYKQGWDREIRDEARSEGIEKGIEKGRDENRFEVAKNLLILEVDTDKIQKATELSIEKILEIKKTLE